MNDDSNLREQFASLRHADAASAPSFERVIGIVRRRSNDAGWRVAIAACILMVAVGGVILRVSHPREAPTTRASAPTLADWRASTDFLLDTPGRELLHTIPELGRRTSTGLDPLPPIGITMPAPRAGLEHS
jgi:hypothetical protein